MITASTPMSAEPTRSFRVRRPKFVARTIHDQRVLRVHRLARLWDSRWQLPGTNFRFGLDSVVGLIPGIGDLLGAGVSLYIVREAKELGVRRRTRLRMLANIAVETVVGSIPLAGDLFDAAWKANQKNVQLIEKHIAAHTPEPPGNHSLYVTARRVQHR